MIKVKLQKVIHELDEKEALKATWQKVNK